MRRGTPALALVAALAFAAAARAQGPASAAVPVHPAVPAPAAPPTLEAVRRDMGIPSRGQDLRGQRDTVGFASRRGQMQSVWELSASPPAPDSLGPAPPGVVAIVAPHDDYVYAGRVYRRIMPLLQARTVVLVGVFHGYARFGVRDRLVFDPYRAWSSPDGPVPVSALRAEVADRLPEEDKVVDAAMHDAEHSLEAQVAWLRHIRPDVEIVPIIVAAASFERLEALADDLGTALTEAMRDRGWVLGRDVAVAISTDGVHYGADFKHTPFGTGGDEAYGQAVARDRRLLTGPMKGAITREGIRTLYATFVDPEHPDTYRLTWCGRFSVPFGLLLLDRLADAAGKSVLGFPIAYSTSIAALPLPLNDIGLGATAPATPEHFVGHPAAAFTLEPKSH